MKPIKQTGATSTSMRRPISTTGTGGSTAHQRIPVESYADPLKSC
jgi:hypothetical protein